ncbi:MAG TPA: PH domain-containing protein [Bacillota bacterium]|nr:PH domain-containing protein [Bacillota bacterium]
MVFRSKTDSSFIIFISVAILIIAVVTIFPIFLEGGDELPVIITLLSVFFLCTAGILWASFAIQYVFYEDYLYVKGGPFRSKIAYENITKVGPSSNFLVGYRILSSTEGIELFYKTALLGSVKISPKEQEKFIAELEKRCPHLEVAAALRE